MPDRATRGRQILAGAPILRGHWGVLIFAWLSGVFADKVEVVDRIGSGTIGDGWVWWPTDTPWALLAIIAGVLGKLSLDTYGRNCWLTWAGDRTWNGLSRDDCNRRPLIRRPRWLTWTG